MHEHSEQGRRRHLLLAGSLAAAVVLAAGTFWAGTLVRDEPQVPRNPVVSPPTVPLEHRLLSDELRADGVVEPPGGVPIAPLSPTLRPEEVALITRLPSPVGTVLYDGSVAVEVAGHPVIVLEGDIPMYRTLRVGSHGPDVAQLQRALRQAGYVQEDPEGTFGVSTAAAAAALFRARGYALPQERPTDNTDPVAAPSRTGRTSGLAGQIGRSSAPSAIVPFWSIVYMRRLPAYVASIQAQVGQPASGTLLTLAHGSPRVVASLEASQLQTVRVGMRVHSPAVAGAVGVISAVSHEGKQGEGSSQGTGKATVSWPDGARLPAIGQEVEVTIVRASSGHPVWCAPFSAIQTNAAGSSYLEARSGSRFVRVPVSLGMSAGGYVAVAPTDGVSLHAEEQLRVSSD